MKVTVLGSGSRGNAIVVQVGDRALLIDAGFGARTLSRRLEAAQLSAECLTAIVLTHEHGDHARGAARFARRYDLPVFGSEGTLLALRHHLKGIDTGRLDVQGENCVGPFRIRACRTMHDAAEPVALRVESQRSGAAVGLAYDLGKTTGGIRSLLRHVRCLLLEANHDDGMLHAGPYPPSVRRRIAGPGGHLSNRAAADLARDVCHGDLETVVLVHISHSCNQHRLARRVVGDALGERRFGGNVLVAHQDAPLAPVHVANSAEQLSLGVGG